jgi:hypothetical protein
LFLDVGFRDHTFVEMIVYTPGFKITIPVNNRLPAS